MTTFGKGFSQQPAAPPQPSATPNMSAYAGPSKSAGKRWNGTAWSTPTTSRGSQAQPIQPPTQGTQYAPQRSNMTLAPPGPQATVTYAPEYQPTQPPGMPFGRPAAPNPDAQRAEAIQRIQNQYGVNRAEAERAYMSDALAAEKSKRREFVDRYGTDDERNQQRKVDAWEQERADFQRSNRNFGTVSQNEQRPWKYDPSQPGGVKFLDQPGERHGGDLPGHPSAAQPIQPPSMAPPVAPYDPRGGMPLHGGRGAPIQDGTWFLAGSRPQADPRSAMPTQPSLGDPRNRMDGSRALLPVFGGLPSGVSPFTQSTSFGGQQFGDQGQAFAQRDALIQRLNDSRAGQAQQWGMGNYQAPPNDFAAMFSQAGDMVQNGWQNPFAAMRR